MLGGHLPLKIATESLKLFHVWTGRNNTNKKCALGEEGVREARCKKAKVVKVLQPHWHPVWKGRLQCVGKIYFCQKDIIVFHTRLLRDFFWARIQAWDLGKRLLSNSGPSLGTTVVVKFKSWSWWNSCCQTVVLRSFHPEIPYGRLGNVFPNFVYLFK